MTRRIWISALLAAIPLVAQTASPYVMLSYFKIKPGQEAAYREYQENYLKAVPELIRSGSRIGYMRLTRVYPSSAETGYDFIGVHYLPGPPDGKPLPESFYTARGMTREQAIARQNQVIELVKLELVREPFAAGARAKAGEYVRLSFLKTESGYTDHYRDYWAGITQVGLDSGATYKGQRLFTAQFPSQSPYNTIRSYLFSDSAKAFVPLLPLQDAFQKAHPKRSYLAFADEARRLTKTVKTEIFRVEFAAPAP